MAGLLDGIDPQTALLLGLGSGLLGTTGQGRRASFGEALANGMQQGTAGYRQAIGDRQRAEQLRMEQAAREQQMALAREQMMLAKANAERDAKLFPGQLQAQQLGNARSQAELDAQQASQRQAAEMRALLANLAGGGGGTMNAGPTLEGPPEPVGLPGGGGGGAASSDNYKARVIQLVQSGQMPAAQGKALIEAADYGRPEVKHNLDARLPDGRPATQQTDAYGRPVGALIPKSYERRFQDFGGTVGALDPYTGARMGQDMPKSMTPDGVASNKVALVNLGVSQARLGLERQRFAADQKGAGDMVYSADAGGFIPKVLRQGEQPTVVPLPGGVGKPPNDVQGKALLFGARMKQADAQITNLENGGTMSGSRAVQAAEATPLIGGALGMAANWFASDNQQSYAQSKRNFVNAALRRESGAVISKEEAANADLQYFPQPGDGPRVLEQKRQNRALATGAILYEAGPHAAQADKLIPKASDWTNGQSAGGKIKPANAPTGQWSNFGVVN